MDKDSTLTTSNVEIRLLSTTLKISRFSKIWDFDIFEFAAQLHYNYDDYHSELFRNEFLANLTKVVDDCIDNGIAPIVTFRHREIENRANEEDLQNYLEWWRIVAEELKDKSYLLSFNLFTEMGVEICRNKNYSCWYHWREVSAIIIIIAISTRFSSICAPASILLYS